MDQSVENFYIAGTLACIAFSVLLVRWLRRRGIKVKWYLYLVLFLFIMSWEHIYSILALQYYCMKDGGLHINRVVQNVDGYFDEGNTRGGIGYIIGDLSKYRFIECNITTPKKDFYPHETGLYRFYLAEKDNPLCKLFYESYEGTTKYSEIRNAAHCVATEKISALKSRYSFHSYDYQKVVPLIEKRVAIVKDMQTGEEMARATAYMRYGGWLFYLLGAGPRAHSPKDTTILYKILKKTLQPVNEK